MLYQSHRIHRTRCTIVNIARMHVTSWLGGVVVMVSDSWSRGHGFHYWPLHYQVMTLGNSFTHICLCHQAV